MTGSAAAGRLPHQPVQDHELEGALVGVSGVLGGDEGVGHLPNVTAGQDDAGLTSESVRSVGNEFPDLAV